MAHAKELTLRDRLSRLNFKQACKLLGPEGASIIRKGGKYSIELTDDTVYLDNELFSIKVHDALVIIRLADDRRNRLFFQCDQCKDLCHHIGAAFSVVLEEKTVLGLARPPDQGEPAESLGEDELIERTLQERKERAQSEPMAVKSAEPLLLWTDYLVTNSLSGKSYRVALRGWDRGQSYCSCPDFRKNTLGTCKHIMKVCSVCESRFSEKEKKIPYMQKGFAVHIQYGKNLELRLLVPEKVPEELKQLIDEIKGKNIQDLHKLLRCIRVLEKAGFSVNIYPDALEYIDSLLYRERIKDLVESIRKDPKVHPLRNNLLKIELLPYQLDGIAFAIGAGRTILADDMGLGKTIQGIGVAELLFRECGIKKVLVVCPTSLKSQWCDEIARFSDRDSHLIIGSAPERALQYANNRFFTICNYEQVLRDLRCIEQVPWDLIILDEGQRIKNWEAKTSRTIKSLRSRFALVLSGTPLENRLDDLFSVIEFVDERRLGPSFRFFNTHRIVNEKGKLLGYKNLEQLRKKLKPILLRRTRNEVMSQLPQRSDQVIRIPPTEQQYTIERSQKMLIQTIINKPYISEMDLLRLQKALLICRMAADSTFLVDKVPPGYSTKLERLAELLEDLNGEEGRKIVLFSEWTTMLDLIEKILKKIPMEYVRLDGSVAQKKRASLVEEFMKKPSCKLFMTTNAGSTGLNLQAADTVINVDLPWNPAVLEQRIARAHRMGQKNPVQVYILVTEDSLEEAMLSTLSAKKEVALAALDMESDVDKVEMVCGAEELKRRMEILLGRPQDALLEKEELEKQKRQIQHQAAKEKMAEAAGELFASAFKFLGQVIPQKASNDLLEKRSQAIKETLIDYMETDENGHLELKLKLPDASFLDEISKTLAKLMV